MAFIKIIYSILDYNVNVPETVNLNIVSAPEVAMAFVPGATAAPAGAHAVGILITTYPDPPPPELTPFPPP
jgi:hypothetical protein